MSTRLEEKAHRREERLEREQAAAAAGARRRRLLILGAVFVSALGVLIAGIAISQSGSSGGGRTSADTQAVRTLFAGIPQKGNVLGKQDAPATLVEYADLQCPVCAAYTSDVLPTVLKDYVRAGRLNTELRLIPIIGPDSVPASRAAAAASLQNRMWQFSDLFYRDQGVENSGYVTDGFLGDLARATPGLNGSRALRQTGSAPVTRLVNDWAASARAAGVNGTPTFFITPRGGTPAQLSGYQLEPGSFSAALDSALRSK